MATLQRIPTPNPVDDSEVQRSPQTFVDRGTPIPPLRRLVYHNTMKLAYWVSSALAVAALVASAVGVFHPSLFRDTAMTAGNARGTDLVILVVALPALLVSMMLAARGSIRAQVVWLGALSYLLYNATFFAFDVAFNQMFFVYIAVLSLAVWSLVALLLEIDVAEVKAFFSTRFPVRTIAAYLVVTALLFALAWLRDILPALANLTTPASLHGTLMLTNPIQVMDFAFGFPMTILAAVWFWQRRPWGYVLAGMFLVYGVIESISVTTDQTFGHLSDPSQPTVMVPAFAVLTVIALIPLVMFLRAIQRDRASVAE
jgi:hypothetical protein